MSSLQHMTIGNLMKKVKDLTAEVKELRGEVTEVRERLFDTRRILRTRQIMGGFGGRRTRRVINDENLAILSGRRLLR